MLYDQQGKQVHIPHNKEISENLRRSLRETKEVLDHKGHKGFSIEERARIKQ